MTDPDDRFDRLPDLPDGDLLCSGFWRSIDEIAGEGCKGSIWIWSNRDRRYRKWVEGTTLAGSNLQSILPDGRLLLSGVANQGRRLESFDPASGKRQLLISDPEAFAFMLSPTSARSGSIAGRRKRIFGSRDFGSRSADGRKDLWGNEFYLPRSREAQVVTVIWSL